MEEKEISSESKNEVRDVLSTVKEGSEKITKKEEISQHFIRAHMLSFLFSPTKAYEGIKSANKSFLNGAVFMALVSAILVASNYAYIAIFPFVKHSDGDIGKMGMALRLLTDIVVKPISDVAYNSFLILIVLAIALFLKNVSLTKITERPFIDNYYNLMAFIFAVKLLKVIHVSPLAVFYKGKAGRDVAFLISNGSSILSIVVGVWMVGLSYFVLMKHLKLEKQHALIALVPMYIPILQTLVKITG